MHRPQRWIVGFGTLVLLVTAVWMIPKADQPAKTPAEPASAGHTAADPLDFVPAESQLCWCGRPFPDAAPPSQQPTPLTTLLDLGMRIAGKPLDGKTQFTVRLFELFGQMVRYPHALALIDVKARPAETNPNSRKMDQLRLVIVAQTKGQSKVFLDLLQKIVNENVDQSTGVLTKKTAGKWSYQELRDQRLPEWSVFAWGELEGHFVVTVGADVWPRIAAVAAGETPALSQDAWVKAARSKRGANALLEIIVAAAGIREKLDPFVDGRATAFFQSWNADDVDRAHWALGFLGRALYCEAHFLKDGKTTERLYADAEARDPRLLATVPETARYAIYQLAPGKILTRLAASYYATRGPAIRKAAEDLWTKIQAEHKLNVQRDLFDHLGDKIVFHNDPPHPLRVPLAMTTLIEIRDEPQRVRKTIETICEAWQAGMRAAAEQDDSLITLQRDSDGVWYFQVGILAGLAWTTTDKFVIASWSPMALREYLEKMGKAVGANH